MPRNSRTHSPVPRPPPAAPAAARSPPPPPAPPAPPPAAPPRARARVSTAWMFSVFGHCRFCKPGLDDAPQRRLIPTHRSAPASPPPSASSTGCNSSIPLAISAAASHCSARSANPRRMITGQRDHRAGDERPHEDASLKEEVKDGGGIIGQENHCLRHRH